MARFSRLSVLNTILDDGLIPIFYNGDSAVTERVAAAMTKGGCHVLEFTNRGDFAIEVFGALVKHCAKTYPDLIIGAGTILDAPTAALYIAHGANFIVSSSYDEQTARLCNRQKIAYVPGCGTATEIATAEEWGAEIVKLFPADGMNGPAFVKALLAPRPWTRLLATGGVNLDLDSMREWFGAGIAAVGMGSKLIRSDWLKAGNFDALQDAAQNALKLIRTARGK